MKAPYSSLAKIIEEKYGGYAVTSSIINNTSIQEAYDKLIKKNIDPWTGSKLKK
jgi:hypothetical protein